MPLLDHFHPPLHPRRKWESFHAAWTVGLAEVLNQRLLPREYYAEVQTHLGARVEIDVATFETAPDAAPPRPDGPGTVAVAAPTWAPPTPALVLPAVFPDTFEVRVFGNLPGGVELVAAIELVSPGNKDRAEERRAFATKCASYLSQGISLIVVDIVSERQANLHNEMMRLMLAPEISLLPPDAGLYAVAYRPVIRQENPEIDLWPATFTVGATLPELPLGLTRGLCVPVDFEATYLETCRRLRLL
jgi:hypothetical protein